MTIRYIDEEEKPSKKIRYLDEEPEEINTEKSMRDLWSENVGQAGATFARQARESEEMPTEAERQLLKANALISLPFNTALGVAKTGAQAYNRLTGGRAGQALESTAGTVIPAIAKMSRAPALEKIGSKFAGTKLGQDIYQFGSKVAESPRARRDIEAAVNVGSMLPLGAGYKVLKGTGEAVAPLSEKALRRTAMSQIKDLSPAPLGLNVKQNIAAQKAGIPLSRAQRANVISGAQPSGVEGAIENVVGGVPGGQGVIVGFKKKQAEEAVKSLERVFGSRLENIDENYAEKIIDDIAKNRALEKDSFHRAYADALDKGEITYIHGENVSKNALRKINQMPEATTLSPEFKTKVGELLANVRDINKAVTTRKVITGERPSDVIEEGYRAGMSKTVLGETSEHVLPQVTSKSTNYEAYRSLQTELLAEKERAWNLVRAGGANKEQARKYATVLGVISKKMKQNEYAHLRMIGGNDLVKNLKLLDRKYGEEIGQMTSVEKILGLGKEAGEKRFKESEVALDGLMNPKNLETTKLAMGYMSPETKQTFGKALLAKVIRPAIKGSTAEGTFTANTIHLSTLDNNFNKYRKGLETLLGGEKVAEFDNFLTGAKKAKLQNINLADATNPSGTGFKNAINTLILGTLFGGVGGGIGGGLHGGATGVAASLGITGIGALTARGLAKRAIKQPKTEVLGNRLRGIGGQKGSVSAPLLGQSVAGGAVGGAVGASVGDTPEERARNAALGFGAGMAAGPIATRLARGLGERGSVGFPKKSPTFFSPLLKAAGALKQEKGTGDQMLSMLKKTPGVKEAEAKWIGLDDFLKGKPSVTKKEIEDFVNANQVNVEEVSKGGKSRLSEKENDELIMLENSDALTAKEEDRLQELKSDIYNMPKYSNYTMPGGENQREILLKTPGKGGDFQSSHWEEPNVLAHIRTNDRTGPNGEKVLFVEEIQSDWAREARKKGVQGTMKPVFEVREFPDEKGRFGIFNTEYDNWANRQENKFISAEDAQKTADRFNTSTGLKGVPNQPFIKNWEDLALKRVLRMAADEGYDRVAWINGAQTAKRYDLSKDIKEISVEQGKYKGEMRKGVTLDMDNYGKMDFSIDDGGVIRDVGDPRLESFIGKNMSDVVGKAIGDKIATTKSGGFKPAGLAIGGEWAQNLYDKVIPNFYEKYGKKWGTKVEPVALGEGSTAFDKMGHIQDNFPKKLAYLREHGIDLDVDPSDPNRLGIMIGSEGDIEDIVTTPQEVAQYDDKFAGNSRLMRNLESLYDEWYSTPETAEGLGVQQSIRITPEMRKSISEGQPLFNIPAAAGLGGLGALTAGGYLKNKEKEQ